MNRISGMRHDQIITLCEAGLTASAIAAQLKINRETVSSHLQAAGFHLPRGRPPSGGRKPAISGGVPADLGPADQIRQFSEEGCLPADSVVADPPTSGAAAGPTVPSGAVSLCEPHRAFIEDRLARGQSAQVIWQDLVDDQGFGGAYDSVKRFVRGIRRRAPDLVGVLPTMPGRESQVDYGRGAPTIHPETGKLRRPWLFCLKLSHSRKAFRKVVWTSSSRVWCELHEEAYRHFGGVLAVNVLDNLKEGVLKPDIYDPELNPLYAAMLAYYGAIATPCRPRLPKKLICEFATAQFVANKENIIAIGPPGTGKSHLMNAIALCAIHAGFAPLSFQIHDLIGAIAEASATGERKAFFARLLKTDLLMAPPV